MEQTETNKVLNQPRHMKRLVTSLFGLLLTFSLTSAIEAVIITEASVPVGSMDGVCWAWNGWSSAPPSSGGIGLILDSSYSYLFSLHDHQYIAPNVPDPSRAVVTYTFDSPAVVTALQLELHVNGIDMLEGFVGNSLNNMTSIGTVIGSLGLGHFSEHSLDTFTFNNTMSGTIFEFVVRHTAAGDGYANYTAIPEFHAVAVPEPSTTFAGALMLLPISATALRMLRKYR